MTLALFGLLLLSVLPAIFSGFYITSTTNIVQIGIAQGEDPFPSTNETLAPAQQQAREQLLNKEGFSINVIARNLSAPLNLLYGPDHTLWITERVGKDIVRIDPTNGTKLSTMPIPDANQSKGQDGVLGMAFDPNFNTTHHIYVAYTYEEDSGEGIPERFKRRRSEAAARTVARKVCSARQALAQTVTIAQRVEIAHIPSQ